MVAMQQKQDKVSLKRVVVELCSELLDMQLEPNAFVLENVQKVVVCTQELAIRMDVVEVEYKARIEELEKRDSTEQFKVVAKEISGRIVHQIEDTTHLLETTKSSWLGIDQIDTVEELCEEIRQAQVEIAKRKEEIAGFMPVQRMVQSGKSKKLQIQLQKLCKEEIEFMRVTQLWQDELVELAQRVETKLAKFKETQAIVGKLLMGQITKEYLEKAEGSIAEMIAMHDKLQDVYTQWFDKTNKIIKECKEQK